MSATAQGVDTRAHLTAWLNSVTEMYIKDIVATPEDDWTATHGGCSKGANAAVGDCVCNLRWTAAMLRGEESDIYNSMKDLAAEFADKNKAAEALRAASVEFGEALAAASDEKLNSTVMAPWQMETPVMMLANIAVSHLWYHDGQLNYIQTIHGDGEVHWM